MENSFVINLDNFQSISSATLEFIPGVNVVVGQSNSGKTAILRAIAATVNNPSRSKYFIKKGTSKAEVDIKFEGNSIQWGRTPSDSYYVVNSDNYKKTGKNSLFDFLPNSGFVRDEDNNIMNIEGEWDLAFPFDRTPSELFKLFENVFCISDSAVILKSFKEEVASIIKDKVTKEDKLNRLGTKLSALNELSKEADVETAEIKLQKFNADIKDYKEISADINSIIRSAEYNKVNFDELKPPTEDSLVEFIETFKDFWGK